MFKVGQKVVCISNIPIFRIDEMFGIRVPVKGEIYTVRQVIENQAITVNEIINPPIPYSNGFLEADFYIHHFREIDETFSEETIANLIEWNETQKITA